MNKCRTTCSSYCHGGGSNGVVAKISILTAPRPVAYLSISLSYAHNILTTDSYYCIFAVPVPVEIRKKKTERIA